MPKAPKQLDELFHEGLKDIYFAEKKILVALPKMAKAAQLDKAKAAFEKHRAETEKQVQRLEQIFAMIDKEPHGKQCPAIIGIVEEGQQVQRVGTNERCNCQFKNLLNRGLKALGLEYCHSVG